MVDSVLGEAREYPSYDHARLEQVTRRTGFEPFIVS